jgi:hypothetical protein
MEGTTDEFCGGRIIVGKILIKKKKCAKKVAKR